MACRITDAGVVVPIDARGADALLAAWFRDVVGRMPDATPNGERELMSNV